MSSIDHSRRRTESPDADVEGGARRLGTGDVRLLQRVERADAARLDVAAGTGQVLARLGQRRTLVDQQRDVDAHDGQDAAHVQVHHVDALRNLPIR